MRTEQEVLKDFEKLGYEIVCNNNIRIELNNIDYKLVISKICHWYFCESVLTTPINVQEHKLLTELFTIWGWLL